MYLHQTSDLKLQSYKIHSSRLPMKIIAYVVAILVPIADPLSCLKKDKLCLKILFFNTHSANPLESLQILSCISLIFKIFLMPSSLQHASLQRLYYIK